NNNTQLCWNNKSGANPFEEIEGIKEFCNYLGNTTRDWKTPDGLLWICGKRAYYPLPKEWRGTCTIGVIQAAFFRLPKNRGNTLGMPL
ncbi:ENR1 protein, partial [Melanocharis versteri]|nr:ENR1 protein [Melanocharis versteri]